MLKMDRILCPVDFSEFSKTALEYALSFARRYKAKLYIQHVIEPVTALFSYETLPGWRQLYAEFRASAQQELDELIAAKAAEQIQPETLLEVGNPADSILKFARKQAIDLIVMGSHGRRGVDRILTGSVTQRVLQSAPCAVLTARRPAHDSAAGERDREPAIRNILVPFDFSDEARQALTEALSLAKECRAQLALLHVMEEIPRGKDLQSEAARIIGEMESSLPRGVDNETSISCVVRRGKPYWEIIQLATESETDLIMMGTHGHGALDLAVFGSTTYRVLQLGPCPVLSVHRAALQTQAKA